ncbi:MAG TPA: fructose-bisphosphatase class II, partial [Patescibacteria group bacterium]|nr:fructose-bisphosphatase class II [Patescibacteria group bacterium]
RGEQVGLLWARPAGGPEFDLAVDPLECTDSVAFGRYNAMSVIVAGAKGSLLSAPDVYMDKIAAGPKAARVIRLNAPVRTNLIKTAKALGKPLRDLTVVVLDRPRHAELILQIRRAGARVRLITDGDVAGAIAPCLPDSGIDLLMGIGASAEAVLAAAAVKIFGGQILCRFSALKDNHVKLIKEAGYNTGRVFAAADLAKGRVLSFTATGVIDGPLLKGVRFAGNIATTHSLAIRGQSGTVRYITAQHREKM